DRGEVDVLQDPLVVVDHAVGHRDAQLGLRTQHGEPESAFGDDLGLRRPDRDHFVAGIAVGQNIRDRHEHTAYGPGRGTNETVDGCTSSDSTSRGARRTRQAWPPSTPVGGSFTSVWRRTTTISPRP